MTKSKQLQELREKLGLTQEQIARLMGVSLQTVWRWLNSKDKKQETPDYVFDLLPILARKDVPRFCADATAARREETFLAQHINGCKQCQMVIQFLKIKAEEL